MEQKLSTRLSALAEKATKGPWLAGGGGGLGATTFVYETNERGQQCCAIGSFTLELVSRAFHEREANAALVSELVNALPTIISALQKEDM